MKKVIFGSSVHFNFSAFLDLYKGVQKFFGKPLYIFASNNEDMGEECKLENLIKIEAGRNYKWRRSHNFLFDAFLNLKGRDYDYFVALDSDCLVYGNRLSRFLEEGDFDFVIYPNLNGLGGWYHGSAFLKNINHYLDILKDLGIERKDEAIVGNFNPMIILSRRAVDFLRDRIGAIESSSGYGELMKMEFSVGETLIFNILKDAGFKYKYIDPKLKRGIRYRPYWEVDEFDGEISVYHPVRRRRKNDLFRHLVGIKAGYDKKYLFLIPIFIYYVYRKAIKAFLPGKSDTGDRRDTGWFNP